MTMPKIIAVGLAKAQIYARGVDKRGRNTVGRGYDYATAEDIISEARKSLMEGGRLIFAVKGWGFQPATVDREARKKEGDNGKVTVLASSIGRITIRYSLIHLDTGEEYCDESTAPVVPDFGRPDDKAEFGASTEAHAYVLRGLLNLPRGVEGAIDMNQCVGEYTLDNPGAPSPPASKQADDAPPAARQEQPPPEQRRPAPTEREPEQRLAVTTSSGSPPLDLFEAILKENAAGNGSPTRIRDAGLPPTLRRQAMADLLGRVIPLQTHHDDLCSWMEWIFAEVPKDTPERDALRIVLTPITEKLGWTIATHGQWREEQKRLREQRAA